VYVDSTSAGIGYAQDRTLGLIVALAACSNDATSPNGSVSGTYSLRTINGSTLPYDFGSGAVLTSDQLTLRSDGSYVDQATFSNGATQTEQGNWSINNNLITFDDLTEQTQYTGSISGSVLTETFSINGNLSTLTEVYQRD